MKILHLVPNYHPFVGGIERVVQELSSYQEKNGDVPIVIFPDRLNKFPNEYIVENVRVIPFHFPKLVLPLFMVGMPINQNYSPKSIARIFANCRSVLTELNPDIIHIHGASEIALPIVNIARSIGIKTIFHAHREYLASNVKPVELKILLMSEHVISVSDAVNETIQNKVNTNTRLSVVHNGIDVESSRIFLRRDDSKRIIMAGRFFSEKGFDLGIRAFEKVFVKHPELSLRILGNGPERRFLEGLVKELNLKNAVDLPGVASRTELMREISGAMCVVIPTPKSEAFGLLAIESMSVGTPVIATKVGGLPEIIQDNVTGLLVEPEYQEIADTIEKIYLDKNLNIDIGLKGQERARTHFNMARFANQIRSEYLVALSK